MSVEVLKQIWPEWQVEDKPLGKGSFGAVYKAVRKDHNVESYAAIKVLSIPADSAEVNMLRAEGLDINASKTYLQAVVDDFVSEIQLMESLKGVQNIVSVEDYKVVEKTNEIGWYVFIRMELLTPFNTYICDKKLTEDEVIKLGCDICTALEICAKRNIVHRDIKPENIFINDFGHFKLGDFGIARKMENMTGGLSQKGTFNYIAPEVANSSDYDARVDIYSLGIVLYRLLNSNRLPLLNTEKQLLNPNERRNAVDRRIRGEELPPPCEASSAMADVILKACAYKPEMRFASASEMKQALMSVANGTYQTTDKIMDRTISVRRAQESGDKATSVCKESDVCDKTTAVRKAPGEIDRHADLEINTFDSTPEKTERVAPVINSAEKKSAERPIANVKENKKKTKNINVSKPKKQNKATTHRLLVFGMPLALLLLYVGFYVLFIPALFGKTISFFSWLFADVDHIAELLENAGNMLTPVYVIILLVIVQYLILGALIASVLFLAKELHRPKVKFNKNMKYTGKAPQMMLENILMGLKSDPDAIDRNAIDSLKTVVESMKYSKAFGVINDANVVELENEICQLIDEIQVELESDSEGSSNRVSKCIMVLKQKNNLRDNMLKR